MNEKKECDPRQVPNYSCCHSYKTYDNSRNIHDLVVIILAVIADRFQLQLVFYFYFFAVVVFRDVIGMIVFISQSLGSNRDKARMSLLSVPSYLIKLATYSVNQWEMVKVSVRSNAKYASFSYQTYKAFIVFTVCTHKPKYMISLSRPVSPQLLVIWIQFLLLGLPLANAVTHSTSTRWCFLQFKLIYDLYINSSVLQL